jgi:hypothetical protein
MNAQQSLAADLTPGVKDGPNLESAGSGIHWGAILGGAAAAAAISLVLIPLGSALGFASFSVFTATANSAIVFTAGWAIWLVVMQWASSFIGGYIAGRLRVRWADLHSDEVFFRDTAHGFLAWAVATLFTFGLIALSASAAAPSHQDNGPDVDYYASSLYRGATASTSDITPETAAILATDSATGTFPADDRAYLAHQVATRSGVSEAEAETRVNATIARIDADRQKVAQAAETTRKAAVGFFFSLFISLLVGAFIASVSAALGGRLRDQY